jgi:predicted esterase
MKRLILVFIVLLLIQFTACDSQTVVPTEAPTEPTVLQTDPIETLPPVTDPPPTEAPTEPPEPTIPSLGEAAGSRFECYYSDEYEDYLNYYVHIPENAVENMPLIVYLHGDGEVNDPHGLLTRGIEKFAKEIYGDDYPFVILEPNTRVKSWTRGNIPELLIGLIDRVAARYSVNVDKIILTGHSRGAIGVWDMISTYPEYFSAAVPVSSPHQEGHIDYIKAAGVPVWTFAGDIGEIERWYHKYLAQNVDQITVCGGFGKFTVLKGCNHGKARVEAYVEETFEWMLAQENGVIPKE